jgi:hypothetical protein
MENEYGVVKAYYTSYIGRIFRAYAGGGGVARRARVSESGFSGELSCLSRTEQKSPSRLAQRSMVDDVLQSISWGELS